MICKFKFTYLFALIVKIDALMELMILFLAQRDYMAVNASPREKNVSLRALTRSLDRMSN